MQVSCQQGERRGGSDLGPDEVGSLLRKSRLCLATAESCTGGKLGDLITDVPGSSDYYVGGVVSYSNEAKMCLIGVRKNILEAKGAVSEEVAVEMAQGVRRVLRADIGVGVTGIAGPTGATRAKPVGLVFVAVASDRGVECKRNLFKGSRSEIKSQSVACALSMIGDHITRHY